MFKRHARILLAGSLLTVAAAVALSCGGPPAGPTTPIAGGATPPPPAATATRAPGNPTPAPTAELTPAPTPAAVATATATALAPTAPSAGYAQSPNLALGKLVFEEKAGGLGCAFCHGLDGSGKGAAGVGAAFIRGRSEMEIRNAMQNVAMMAIVKLTDAEITAVAEYLQYLDAKFPQ